VIGWALDEHMPTDLVQAALAMAVAMRGGLADEVILHADRGCQYTSAQLARFAREHNLVRSVGRTAVCWDNAQAESFWATMNVEFYDRYLWPTKAAAKLAGFPRWRPWPKNSASPSGRFSRLIAEGTSYRALLDEVRARAGRRAARLRIHRRADRTSARIARHLGVHPRAYPVDRASTQPALTLDDREQENMASDRNAGYSYTCHRHSLPVLPPPLLFGVSLLNIRDRRGLDPRHQVSAGGGIRFPSVTGGVRDPPDLTPDELSDRSGSI
jgi:hypothetical protein